MTRITASLLAAAALVGVPIDARAGDAHSGPVTDIAIGDVDGKVYSCSQGGIFEGTRDQLRLEHRPGFRVTCLANFKPGGSDDPGRLIAGGEPGVSGSVGWRELDADHSQTVAKDMIYSIACAPDQQLVAIACASGEVLVRKGTAGARGWTLRHQHTATARAVAFSPDGKWLASAGLDGVVIVSPTSEGDRTEPLHLVDHTAGVECLAFSPDSNMIASGSRDSKVRVHLVSGPLVRSYHGLGMAGEPVAARVPSRVLSIAWGKELLVAGTSKGTLHRLSLEDDSSSSIPHTDHDPITALEFDLGRQQLVIGTSSVTTLDLKDIELAD